MRKTLEQSKENVLAQKGKPTNKSKYALDTSMFSIGTFSVDKWNKISNKVESEAKGDYSTSEFWLSEILFSNLSYLLNVGYKLKKCTMIPLIDYVWSQGSKAFT